MEYTSELESLCAEELAMVCGEDRLDIEIPEFSLSDEDSSDKGTYDNEKDLLIVYCCSHDTIDDILKSVRHEARHKWQWKHYHDLCQWWKDNIAFYILVQSPQFHAEYHWICVHELDAEEYASSGSSAWETRLSIEPGKLERKARDLFREIAPSCAPGVAEPQVRISYCALLKQGWLV